jgi:hypothetical protein
MKTSSDTEGILAIFKKDVEIATPPKWPTVGL